MRDGSLKFPLVIKGATKLLLSFGDFFFFSFYDVYIALTLSFFSLVFEIRFCGTCRL